MTTAVPEGVGRRLAEAREARGLSVAEVGEKLKLTSRQVEAIEAEDFGRLPALVFVRGFIRNYARLLDLDADALLGQSASAPVTTETITAPSEGLRLGTSPVRRWLLLPLALAAVFLLLVAALYTWLKQGEVAYVTAPAATQAIQPVTPMLAVPIDIAPTPASEPMATPVTAPPPTPTAWPTPTLAPTPVPPTPAAPPARQSPAATGGEGTAAAVQFQASQEAWIEVIAGDGRRYSRLMREGELLTVRGTPPFQVVVGNAAHVRMGYNNRPIDLRPYIGDKVARFTLE